MCPWNGSPVLMVRGSKKTKMKWQDRVHTASYLNGSGTSLNPNEDTTGRAQVNFSLDAQKPPIVLLRLIHHTIVPVSMNQPFWIWVDRLYEATSNQQHNQQKRSTTITVTSEWVLWRHKSPASRLFARALFRRRSRKTSKLRITDLCEGEPPLTGGFP